MNIESNNSSHYHLTKTTAGLVLQDLTHKFKPLIIDFNAINWQRCHTTQLSTKAVGIKKNQPLTILDATAGLGIDAFIFANFGAKVQMIERSPIIGTLLQDGLDRFFSKNPTPKISLTLTITDAISYLQKRVPAPDVIYLDPMYPERGSALNKKNLRILRAVVGNDEDAEELFWLALKCTKKRVVVKRPRLAPTLTHLKPDIIYSGKSVRFDVYTARTWKCRIL